MQMPGRSYTDGTGYRYGFNGKENDNDVKGSGNQQDYGMRIYDPRLGRFLSVDPITKDYPWYTPYQFAGNKPIAFIDLDGLEEARKGVIKMPDEYDQANHPIQAGIQQIFFSVASAAGVNLMDDMLQEVTWGLKGEQSWGDVGRGLINTFYKTTAPNGVPIVNIAAGPTAPPPAAALSVEGCAVVVPAVPKPILIAPTATVVLSQGSQQQSSSNNDNTSSSSQGSPTLQQKQATSKLSEAEVEARLSLNLKPNEILMKKVRFYINGGKNYTTPDFSIYNTKENQFVKIPDAKNGNANLTPNQNTLNKQGGEFRGSSRYPQAKPQSIAPGKVTKEPTAIPYN